jgi:hypothetical protein
VNAHLQTVTERIALRFVAVNATMEAAILMQRSANDNPSVLFQFDVDAHTIERIAGILAQDADLWQTFQRAIQAHRPATHWAALLEHAIAVGQLQARLYFLEQGLLCSSKADRYFIAEHLNCVDGEIGLCRQLADRRDLARRINEISGFPFLDGLTLRGLTFLLGEHAELWRDFRALIGDVLATSRGDL